MSADLELKVGRTYRAKKPTGISSGFAAYANDRQIVWLGVAELQYDGPAVGHGRHYPKVSIEAFRKWASRDVTDELPEGEYARWPLPARSA